MRHVDQCLRQLFFQVFYLPLLSFRGLHQVDGSHAQKVGDLYDDLLGCGG